MISNQILQETINGMKEVTGIDLCILDLSGRIVVTTMEITDALHNMRKNLQILWQRAR